MTIDETGQLVHTLLDEDRRFTMSDLHREMATYFLHEVTHV